MLPDLPIGDELSHEELARRLTVLQAEVIGFMRRGLPEGRGSDAEDLWQTLMMQLLKRSKPVQWQGAVKFRGFVYEAVGNKLKDWYRAAMQQPAHLTTGDSSGGSATVEPAAKAESVSERLRRREWFEKVLRLARPHLSEEDFTIVWLHYAEELPWEDVAQRVGKSVPAVRKQASRAMKILREHLRKSKVGSV